MARADAGPIRRGFAYSRIVQNPDSLAALLAAVGNHEAKALTFVSLEPEEAYGIGALHRRFLEIQGPTPAFVGTVALQQKYCVYSFEPANLVRRTYSEDGFIRHVKQDADGTATALAGHLLTVTERRFASLSQIFGQTAVQVPDATPTPFRRLRLLRALLEGPYPMHAANLAQRTGLPEMVVSTSLVAFARARLLDHQSTPTYRMKSVYEVHGRLRHPERPGNTALNDAVVEFINNQLPDVTGAVLVIRRDEIEAHLRTKPRWRETKNLRDMLQLVMRRLAAQGQVTPVRHYAGKSRHTAITLTLEQREFISALINGIDEIAAHNKQSIENGTAQAHGIVEDPVRVRRLLSKAYGTSKLADNPVSAAEKQRRILAILHARAGLTTEEITAELQPDLNEALTRGTLAELARAGRVRGERQPDGPYKRWYVT